jgi:N-acetylmuramoyl-L-alanine amidase
VIERPSPNHDPRRAGAPIDILLLHYTGMETAEAALARLCDPAAKVSAHYTIDEDGTLHRHVPEDRRAWHAGKSFWAGERDVNSRSIGIELVNPGHEFGYRPFPEAQMAALIPLAREIVARHAVPAARVLGHSDVAPGRRQDPGELFDWAGLAQAGIGTWPTPEDGPGEIPIERVQAQLAEFGYDVPGSGALDDKTRAALTAFQRHFRPQRIDGVPDAETTARLASLCAGLGE